MTTRIFLFVFLRGQNSQHFNEDLLAVNASPFNFVLCFQAINCAGASNYAIINCPSEFLMKLLAG